MRDKRDRTTWDSDFLALELGAGIGKRLWIRQGIHHSLWGLRETASSIGKLKKVFQFSPNEGRSEKHVMGDWLVCPKKCFHLHGY